jgi:hypothetical protein
MMPTIQAWQHIYSNVEQEQSPQGRGGFQTLFYTTSGLTEAEVQEMEGRLLYFPSRVEPVKRLFFTIGGGKAVVAQIVSMFEPDQYGRKGRYLAHSLIFAPADLARFEADPFRVFRAFSFITTVAEALKQGEFQTGNLPAVSLDLPATAAGDVEAARSWSTAEFKKLGLLALRVDRQTRERDAVTFAGDAAQIENALEAAFLVVPQAMRPGCSFDTYFYRCNLVATYFWAIGLPEPPARIKFAQVDSAARQVAGEIPGQPETAYERWIMAAIDAGQLAELPHRRDNAFAVAEWLENRPYDIARLEAASPELITAVFKVTPNVVYASVQRRVSEHLPEALVDRAARRISEQTAANDLYRHLRQGFELSTLVEVLYDSYDAQNFVEPSRDELKALDQLLKKTDHPMLRLFYAYWSSRRKQFPRELEQLSEADYRRFSEIALRRHLVAPLSLVGPGRGQAFLDIYLPLERPDLLELTEALIEAEETNSLSRLAPEVRKLPDKPLRKLAKLVDKHTDIPRPFRQAVDEAIAALPEQTGFKRLIGAVRRHLPGGD